MGRTNSGAQSTTDQGVTPVPLFHFLQAFRWQATLPFSAPIILLAIQVCRLLRNSTKLCH